MKSKKAHSYHQPRSADEDYGLRLETVLAQICAGRGSLGGIPLPAGTDPRRGVSLCGTWRGASHSTRREAEGLRAGKGGRSRFAPHLSLIHI